MQAIQPEIEQIAEMEEKIKEIEQMKEIEEQAIQEQPPVQRRALRGDALTIGWPRVASCWQIYFLIWRWA